MSVSGTFKKIAGDNLTLGTCLSGTGVLLFVLNMLSLLTAAPPPFSPMGDWRTAGWFVTLGWLRQRWEAGLLPFDARRVAYLKRIFTFLNSSQMLGMVLFGGFLLILITSLFLVMLLFATALSGLHS